MAELFTIQDKAWVKRQIDKLMELGKRAFVYRRRVTKHPNERLIIEAVEQVPVGSLPVTVRCPVCQGTGRIPYVRRVSRGGDKPPIDYQMNARCACSAGVALTANCLSYQEIFGTYPDVDLPAIDTSARVVYEAPRLPPAEAKMDGVLAFDMTAALEEDSDEEAPF